MAPGSGDMVGFGVYQHHVPPCAPETECGWCDRERARQSPERVALRDGQEQRIGRRRRYGKGRR
jgi:hypothetical protein